jgi:hypothetical protein
MLGVVIFAVLLTIMALVLISIFSGKFKVFGQSNECKAQGGVCAAVNEECPSTLALGGCPKEKPVCCATFTSGG